MTCDLRRGPASTGPLGVWGRYFTPLTAALLAGCAATGPAPEPGEPGPDPTDEGPPAEADAPSRSEMMDRLEPLIRGEEHERVVVLADSLYFVSREAGARSDAVEALWWEARSLAATGDTARAARRLDELLTGYSDSDRGDEATRALARMRVGLGDDPGAVSVLLDHPDAIDDEALDVLRQAASNMSIRELRDATDEGEAASRGSAVVEAELAFALARADRGEEARRVASRVVDGPAEQAEDLRARRVLDGGVEPWAGRFRLGVLVPTSGRLEQVGGWILDGMRLASGGYGDDDPVDAPTGEPGATGEPRFEFVVEDAADGRDLATSVARLQESGVVAVVGGVRSSDLEDLADGRSGPGFLVVSPTATRMPGSWLDMYTLWEAERRALDGSRALGRWMGTEAGIGEVAALYPAGEAGVASLVAFRSGLAESGGWLAASVSYAADTTDYQGPIDRVGAFDPGAVFVAAASSNTVLQLVPQLSYYGMGTTVVAGDPTWAEPAALRRLEPSVTQLRLVASLLDRGIEGSGWERFRSAYEREHRRGLGNNVLPALGHDAFLLLERAASDLRLPRPRALARRFAALADVEAATGVLRPRRLAGTVERQGRVRAVRERALAPVEASEVVEWLASAERVSDAQRRQRRSAALEAVREAVERAGASREETGGADATIQQGGER